MSSSCTQETKNNYLKNAICDDTLFKFSIFSNTSIINGTVFAVASIIKRSK